MLEVKRRGELYLVSYRVSIGVVIFKFFIGFVIVRSLYELV